MWYVLRRLGAFDSADYIYKLDVYNDLDIFINLQVLSYTRITLHPYLSFTILNGWP